MSLVSVKTAEASFKDSILQLQDIFTHFDKLGSEGVSGALTTEKLGEALRTATGVSFTEAELRDMVAAVDLNASGDVQFNEFLKMMDAAKHDAALQNPRVTVADLAAGMGTLGFEAAAPEGSIAADAAAANDDDHDDEEHKSAPLMPDPRPDLLKAARLQAEAEYTMTREDVRAVFQAFDTDGDGRISMRELQAMLTKFGEKYEEEEVHAMIHLADPSNSGMMSYQAFVRLMMAVEE